MRRRYAALTAVVMAVLLIASQALPALGAVDHYITVDGPDGPEAWPVSYQQGGANDGVAIITDPACGTADQDFRAVFYDHGSFNGDRVILCRSESDFCTIPGHGYPLGMGCFFTGWFNNANDEFLSVSVGDIKAAGGCLRYFEHAGFSTAGQTVRLREYTQYASIPQVGGDGSSVKRLFAGNC